MKKTRPAKGSSAANVSKDKKVTVPDRAERPPREEWLSASETRTPEGGEKPQRQRIG